MLPNTPPMVEAHFGVPMAGAVLNALNTRLDPEAMAFMLDHGEAKVLIVDPEFAPVMKKALALRQSKAPLLVIDVEDALYGAASPSAAPPTRPSWPRAMPISPGAARPTNGTPSR
jgi:fatty-acyl-CoA synthase